MIQFPIVKKKLDLIELRAYVNQAINENLGYDIGENILSRFPQLGDNPFDMDLNQLNESEILSFFNDSLYESGESMVNRLHLPDVIFYFKTQPFSNYKDFPTIYTGVEDISSENNGLIVMEKFVEQHYCLLNRFGDVLISSCHDIELGADGQILVRDLSDLSGQWNLYNFNGTFLEYVESYEYCYDLNEFSSVSVKNTLPEALDNYIYKEDNKYYIQKLSKDEVAIELKKNDYNCFYLAEYYCNDEQLALVALQSSVRVFSFLSDELRSDKKIVLNALQFVNENESAYSVYSHLNPSLKIDKDIIRLSAKNDKSFIKNIPSNLLSNHDFVCLIIDANPYLFSGLPHNIRQNELIREFIHSNHFSITDKEFKKIFSVQDTDVDDGLPF
jgi:hypothetical protein